MRHRNIRRLFSDARAFLPLMLFAILMLPPIPASAQKTDIITFKNGDQLTVDIKEFSRGRLRASTTGIGTIYIEWRVIESVETSKTYDVELDSGVHLLGTMRRSEADDGILVQTTYGPRTIDFADVTTITRIKREQSVWSRIDGSVRLGLNYTAGSDIGQTNFGLNAAFNEAKYIVGTEVSATFTTGSATNDTQRFNWGVNYWRILRNRWFWIVNSDLDRNEELGIDLRALVGGGAGRFLIKNNSSRWSVGAGLAASRELRAVDADKSNLEGQLATDYSLYFFVPRKTELNLTLVMYPGITQSDRLRGNFDARIRWEIIADLTWDLSYFFTWDNQPPTGASSEDSGVTTSIGYTF